MEKQIEINNNKRNKEIIFSIIKVLFFTILSLSCFLADSFKIGSFNFNNFLLGIFIFFINYWLVFVNFKKNKGFLKFLFFLEFCVFSVIGLINIFSSDEKILRSYDVFKKTYIIYYILIFHCIIQLYISYLKNNKNIFSSYYFFLNLFFLSLSFYLLGKGFEADKFIQRLLGSIFLFCSIFVLTKILIKKK
ncbi:hypothetical protein [Candidatus Phytoplasma pini]|uniref:Integral membrane protein n=1 Tax=Candidatus Phytoplasma pini TaxID=267362 RepID=A0A559KJU3_9MOLU|nr:hypothetical protein [Candidatus Phytoplasma pini]TVY12404.1 hypothetical protein MDPP_0020 [Candidatus Phytoplasma pini]